MGPNYHCIVKPIADSNEYGVGHVCVDLALVESSGWLESQGSRLTW
jgi:hypothetical protein